MYKKYIEKLRGRVDFIDCKLVFLLAERLKITEEIISLKGKNGLPAEDKIREKYILEETGKVARKLKINLEFVRDIFKRILRESRKI